MRYLKRSISLLILILIIVLSFCSCEKTKDDRVFFEAILELNDLDEDMNFFKFKEYFQKKLNRLSVVSKIDDHIFYNGEFQHYTMIFKELDIVDYADLEIYLVDKIQNTEILSTKQYKISYTLISSDGKEYNFIDYWDIYIEDDKIFNGFVKDTSDIVKCSEEEGHLDDGKIVDEQLIDGGREHDDIIMSKITYMSDGLEVFGFMTRPADEKTELPLIVILRGGYGNEYWRETITGDNAYSEIARKGYVVIAPQYRGGAIGKDELGGEDLNDVTNMIELAKGLDYVDADDIYLIGNSRGGLMALLMAREHVEGVRGGAILSGLYSMLFNYYYYERASGFFENTVGLGTPEDNLEGYVKRSATMWANEIDIPLLMIHGKEDIEHCPIAQVYEFIDQMDRYGKEYEFIELEGVGHQIWDHPIKPYDKALEYIESISNS